MGSAFELNRFATRTAQAFSSTAENAWSDTETGLASSFGQHEVSCISRLTQKLARPSAPVYRRTRSLCSDAQSLQKALRTGLMITRFARTRASLMRMASREVSTWASNASAQTVQKAVPPLSNRPQVPPPPDDRCWHYITFSRSSFNYSHFGNF